MSEINLFVIWSNARSKEKEILDELKNNFKILEVYEIEWKKENFKHNLERFYCELIRKKIHETGTGKFLLVTVEDDNPQYGYEKTLNGVDFVNVKTLNLKKKFQKLTGCDCQIHSADNISETDFNLMFFLNKSYEEYREYAKNKVFDGNYIQIKQEPVGTQGWDSIEQVFKLLNSSCNYVMLRDFDKQELYEKGGNIVLLVDNFKRAAYLLNAKKAQKQDFRSQVKVNINNEEVRFDLRYIGDNYYCEKWEEDILKNRVKHKNGYFIPNNKDLLNTLIYHSYIHKKKISHKYDRLIKQLSGSEKNVEEILYNYMKDNDYYWTTPLDKKVIFNKQNIRKIEWYNILSSQYNFENIQGLDIKEVSSSGFEFFFTANFEGKKVFIKCGNGNFDAKREYYGYQLFYKQAPQYFPEPIMYRNLANNKMFICSEFIEGEKLTKELLQNSSNEKTNKIFDSLCNIATVLFDNKIVHRDINLTNILVLEDGTVKLVDFQHLVGRHFTENPDNILHPKKLRGTNKKLRPLPFVWDDMYAIYHMLTEFDKSKINDYDKKISNIKSKIGKLQYNFLNNKFPIKAYFNFKLLIFYKLHNTITKPLRKLLTKKTK